MGKKCPYSDTQRQCICMVCRMQTHAQLQQTYIRVCTSPHAMQTTMHTSPTKLKCIGCISFFLSLARSLIRSFARILSLFAFVCFHSIIIELFRIVCYELYIHLLFNQIKMIRIKMPNRSHCKINCRMLRATENVQIFQWCCCFLDRERKHKIRTSKGI